jgi:hypothetical protein
VSGVPGAADPGISTRHKLNLVILVAGAFAADAATMSMAAFESIEGIGCSASLPRGLGWPLIRSYYAAFFAAYALGRMFGRTLVQLDGPAVASVNSVSGACGVATTGSLQRGFFRCVANGASRTVTLIKSSADRSHGALWGEFVALLKHLENTLLAQPAPSAASSRVAAQLLELRTVLSRNGHMATGSWLSDVRNRVTYKHGYGAWFPYGEWADYYDSLVPKIAAWTSDPDKLSAWLGSGRELQQFVESCVLVVALCRSTCLDMADRCPKGKSFHDSTSVRLIRQIRAV